MTYSVGGAPPHTATNGPATAGTTISAQRRALLLEVSPNPVDMPVESQISYGESHA